jgi:alpha-glucosidase
VRHCADQAPGDKSLPLRLPARLRKSGERWFLPALTDENPRDMSLKLDFLGDGRWKMRLWKDAGDSDVNAEHIETEERAASRRQTC